MYDSQNTLANILRSDYLHLIIMPTEACNFRCHYCYEKFAHGVMHPAIVNGLKTLLTNRASTILQLDISWFGGEPLIAQKVIDDVCHHISELRKIHKKLKTRMHITTNGFLLNRDVFDHLFRHGIRSYQITLDGNEPLHNKTRVLLNGQGSFKQIWNNLLDIRNSNDDFEVILRVHYTIDNWKNLQSLIVAINSEFGIDQRFRIFFKPIGRYGGPKDDQIVELQNCKQEEIESNLRSMVVKPESVVQNVQSGDIRQVGDGTCYASRANSLVIRPDGGISKCTVALYDENNKVGTLTPEGQIKINMEKFRLWLIGLESGKNGDMGCPYNTMRSQIN